jgi:hypothetical protein
METPMTTVPAPEWLTRRGVEFRSGLGTSWYVVFDRKPQYGLRVAPAAGKYTCDVWQAVNGKRLDKGTIYPSAEDALRSGLEELRQALGW